MKNSEIVELIKDYQTNGSEKSFDKLRNAFQPMLYHIARKHRINDLDLWSEINFCFLKSVLNFNTERNVLFKVYMYVYVDRSVKNWYRRHYSLIGKRSGEGGVHHYFDLEENISSSEDNCEHNQLEIMQSDLSDCITSVLTPQEFMVVENFFGLGDYNEAMSCNAVARKTGISRRNVKLLLENALTKLRGFGPLKELCNSYIDLKDMNDIIINEVVYEY